MAPEWMDAIAIPATATAYYCYDRVHSRRNQTTTMGQVCSGEETESRKASAFEAINSEPEIAASGSEPDKPPPAAQNSSLDEERIKEQARLDMIVSSASRGMVSVRSTRGSTGYDDVGFGAALARHLEQTTQFAPQLPIRLPPASSSSVYENLNQPQWSSISPEKMDEIAEALLESVVPRKERLLSGVTPIVENLL